MEQKTLADLQLRPLALQLLRTIEVCECCQDIVNIRWFDRRSRLCLACRDAFVSDPMMDILAA